MAKDARLVLSNCSALFQHSYARYAKVVYNLGSLHTYTCKCKEYIDWMLQVT